MEENLVTCGVMFVEKMWVSVECNILNGDLSYVGFDDVRYLVGELSMQNPVEVKDPEAFKDAIASGAFGKVTGMIMGSDKVYAVLSDKLVETRDITDMGVSTGKTLAIELNVEAE